MPRLPEGSNASSGQCGDGVQKDSTKKAVRLKKKPGKPWLTQTLSWRPGQYVAKKTVKQPVVQIQGVGPPPLSFREEITGVNDIDPSHYSTPYLQAVRHAARSGDDIQGTPYPTQNHEQSRHERRRQDEYHSQPPSLQERYIHQDSWDKIVHPQYAVTPTILDMIPTPLTRIEKTTLWNYFNFVPRAAYGTSGTGPLCVFRDISFPCCQRYPQALTWMLIAAERHTAIRNRLPQPQSLLRRKADAYKAIGQLLQDEAVKYTDEALVVIIGAIVIESRFLDVEVTRMHMKGLETLIQQRGGLPSLFHSSAVMYHPLFYLGYLTSVPLALSSQTELDTCRGSFIASFMEMKKWNQDLCHLATQLHARNQRADDGYLRTYVEARRRMFASPVAKHYLFSPKPSSTAVEETYHARTSRFTVLYLLNLILYWYNPILPSPSASPTNPNLNLNLHPFTAAITFLSTLSYSLHHSGTINTATGTSSIRLEILVWIVAKAWVDSDAFFASSQRGGDEELYLTEMTVRAVKVWGTLGEGRRGEVLRWLRGWVMQGFEDGRGILKRRMRSLGLTRDGWEMVRVVANGGLEHIKARQFVGFSSLVLAT